MQKLSRRTRWIYGSGDIGFSLTSTIIAAYFAIYLTDVVGIAPAVAAASIFIGRTWETSPTTCPIRVTTSKP